LTGVSTTGVVGRDALGARPVVPAGRQRVGVYGPVLLGLKRRSSGAVGFAGDILSGGGIVELKRFRVVALFTPKKNLVNAFC